MWHQWSLEPKLRACTFLFHEQLLCKNESKQSPQVTSWFSMEYVCRGGGVMMGMCEGSGSKAGNWMNKFETWEVKQLCWLNNMEQQVACIWALRFALTGHICMWTIWASSTGVRNDLQYKKEQSVIMLLKSASPNKWHLWYRHLWHLWYLLQIALWALNRMTFTKIGSHFSCETLLDLLRQR